MFLFYKLFKIYYYKDFFIVFFTLAKIVIIYDSTKFEEN